MEPPEVSKEPTADPIYLDFNYTKMSVSEEHSSWDKTEFLMLDSAIDWQSRL